MRHLRVLGSCLLLALLASSCNRTSVSESTDAKVDDGSESVAEVSQPTDEVDVSEVVEASNEQLDAEVVLASALTQAKSDDKNVFVHLGAPW